MGEGNPEPELPKELISDEKQLSLLIEQAYKFKKTIVRAHDEVDEKFQEMIVSQRLAEEKLRAHVLCGGELPPKSAIRIARIEGRKDYTVDAKMLLGLCDLFRSDGRDAIANMIEYCITTKEREPTTQLRYYDG
jgi:hypothetical protein